MVVTLNNSSDAVCRIVDHTHKIHQLALVRATFLKLRLTEDCRQDIAERNDMDTYFVMYRWTKTCIL